MAIGNANRLRTPEYIVWASMRQRCNNPKHSTYKWYGAKGVKVCIRWSSFSVFLADMGTRPPGTSLDRFPDNKGNYEPGNCRWATRKEQANNRTCNVFVTIDGVTKQVSEFAQEAGIPYSTLLHRVSGKTEFSSAVLHTRSARTRHVIEHDGKQYSCNELCRMSGLTWLAMMGRINKYRSGLLGFHGLLAPTKFGPKRKASEESVAAKP